jgi:putative hydrolase of the HAD superfamily
VIEAVLVDLDGTLVDRDAGQRGAEEALFERWPREFPRARRALDRRAWARMDGSGRVSREAWSSSVRARHPALGLSPEELWGWVAPRVAAGTRAFPGAVAWLRALARRVPVAVVTNGGSARQREKLWRTGLDRLGLPVLVSQEEGCAKPRPELFLRALRRLGVQPGRALVVGDDPARDLAPALRLGAGAVLTRDGRLPWGLA